METRGAKSVWLRTLGVVAVGVLAACGGGDDEADDPDPRVATGDATGDAADAAAEPADADVADPGDDSGDDGGDGGAVERSTAASWADVDGELFEFTSVTTCVIGDDFWGPDFRRISVDTAGEYPAMSVGYAPAKADDEGVEDPNVVAMFPSVDPWYYTTDVAGLDDLDLTLTADGVAGSATLGVVGEGGPSGEFAVTFELSCAASSGGSDGDGSDAAADPDDADAAPEVDIGTFELDGEVSELTGPSQTEALLDADLGLDPNGDFDFDICETVNPAFAGAFNISGTLSDGTGFHLSGTVDAPLDDNEGLFIGEFPDEERAEELQVELDGRTLSGSARTSRGVVEFSFTC